MLLLDFVIGCKQAFSIGEAVCQTGMILNYGVESLDANKINQSVKQHAKLDKYVLLYAFAAQTTDPTRCTNMYN